MAAVLPIQLPGGGFIGPEGSARAMLWSSIGEGIGLFLVGNLLLNTGHTELLLTAMALIVGLHFIPIAYRSPFRSLYVLVIVIMVAGTLGLWLHQPAGGAIAGFTAAAVLAMATIVAVQRERLAKLRYQLSLQRWSALRYGGGYKQPY